MKYFIFATLAAGKQVFLNQYMAFFDKCYIAGSKHLAFSRGRALNGVYLEYRLTGGNVIVGVWFIRVAELMAMTGEDRDAIFCFCPSRVDWKGRNEEEKKAGFLYRARLRT